jgi:hypothetical protein
MALMLVLHAGASGPAVGEPGMPTAMAIVVGVDSPIRDLTPDVLREVYMRRRRVWPDGRRVMPVNLPADDPLRSSFSAHNPALALGRRSGYRSVKPVLW